MGDTFTVSPEQRLRWVAPPSWPSPPAGWYPLPGWEPDPSWPPAPADWVWWQPAHYPGLSKKQRWAWVAFTAVIVVAAVASGLAGAIASYINCDSREDGQIHTMRRVITPLLPESDRASITSEKGCDSFDDAILSWETSAPVASTWSRLHAAGWTQSTPEQAGAEYVTDGWTTTVGKQHFTIVYIAEDAIFQADMAAP